MDGTKGEMDLLRPGIDALGGGSVRAYPRSLPTIRRLTSYLYVDITSTLSVSTDTSTGSL